MSNNHPTRLGNVNIKIVVLVPKRFLIKPENTQEMAPPKGIIETAQENSLSVITKAWLELRIIGPAGADHPIDSPNIKGPILAEIIAEISSIKYLNY